MKTEPEICPCCGELKFTVERRRMNTSYVNEDSNYETCCLECHDGHEEYWRERWEEYYAGCM